MKKILLVWLLLCCPQAFAAYYSVTGKVTGVITSQVENTPYIGISVEGVPTSTCTSNGMGRVAIALSNPLADTAFSLATAAVVSGKTVTISYYDTCTVISNLWDFKNLKLND
jgi:hypothetical protein